MEMLNREKELAEDCLSMGLTETTLERDVVEELTPGTQVK